METKKEPIIYFNQEWLEIYQEPNSLPYQIIDFLIKSRTDSKLEIPLKIKPYILILQRNFKASNTTKQIKSKRYAFYPSQIKILLSLDSNSVFTNFLNSLIKLRTERCIITTENDLLDYILEEELPKVLKSINISERVFTWGDAISRSKTKQSQSATTLPQHTTTDLPQPTTTLPPHKEIPCSNVMQHNAIEDNAIEDNLISDNAIEGNVSNQNVQTSNIPDTPDTELLPNQEFEYYLEHIEDFNPFIHTPEWMGYNNPSGSIRYRTLLNKHTQIKNERSFASQN
jgi:hypothetical protein